MALTHTWVAIYYCDLLIQQSPTFLAPGTCFVEDNFPRTGWGGWMVQAETQAMGSDGEQWGAADEASLTRPPLIFCCVARFLTGCGPVPVHGPGVGDPLFNSFAWWNPLPVDSGYHHSCANTFTYSLVSAETTCFSSLLIFLQTLEFISTYRVRHLV